MDLAIEKYIERNKNWAARVSKESPELLKELAKGQEPKILLIGCSDSRVPPAHIMGADPGEIFTHRNIANMVHPDDNNTQSVIQYAIETLHVEYIIILGHYKCGGVMAATCGLDHKDVMGNWLLDIENISLDHQEETHSLDEEEKWDRLVELNVIQQVRNVKMSPAFIKASKEGRSPEVYGWVYDLHSGLLNTDLSEK